MRVRDVMSWPVATIRARETVWRAKREIARTGLHHLVVTDSHNRVRGVVAAADLRDAPWHGCVEDFMSKHVYPVGPNDSIETAAGMMHDHAIGSLPVLDGSRLVGIVTTSDLLALVRANAVRM